MNSNKISPEFARHLGIKARSRGERFKDAFTEALGDSLGKSIKWLCYWFLFIQVVDEAALGQWVALILRRLFDV